MPPPVPLMQWRLFVIDTRTAVCRNDTTGEVVALDLPDVGLSTQLGLGFGDSDDVSITVRGNVR
ncbi:MAG: hypothetical protein AAF184_09595 [Pseudomonadota bacterium]